MDYENRFAGYNGKSIYQQRCYKNTGVYEHKLSVSMFSSLEDNCSCNEIKAWFDKYPNKYNLLKLYSLMTKN